jgi:hypothetical protein
VHEGHKEKVFDQIRIVRVLSRSSFELRTTGQVSLFSLLPSVFTFLWRNGSLRVFRFELAAGVVEVLLLFGGEPGVLEIELVDG